MSLPPLPFKVKTVVSWAGEEPGDLGFMEKELVDVYSIVDESWWSGKLRRNGAEGIFPKDYVQILDQGNFARTNAVPGARASAGAGASSSSLVTTPVKNDTNNRSGSGTPSYSRAGNQLKSPLQYPITNNSFGYASPSQRNAISKSTSQLHDYDYDYDYDYGYSKANTKQEMYKTPNYNSDSRIIKLKNPGYQVYEQYGSTTPQSRHTHSQQNLPNSKNKSGHSYNSRSYDDLLRQQSPAPVVEPNSAPSYKQKHSSLRRIPKEEEIIQEYKEIAKKRAQLEIELQKLKNGSFEQKLYKDAPKPSSPSRLNKTSLPGRYNDEFSLDSYNTQSDDMVRMNNRSRDDLSKKLSSIPSDDMDYVYISPGPKHYVSLYPSNASPPAPPSPPPPPPLQKRTTIGDDLNEKAIYRNRSTSPSPSPSPPPPPRHKVDSVLNSKDYRGESLEMRMPFDGDDFKISSNQGDKRGYISEETYQQLYMQHEELKNSIKSLQSDVMNLSEMSATSAGSFMRHKYEKELQSTQSRMKELNMDVHNVEDLEAENDADVTFELRLNVMDSVFESKKKNSNIFKKMLRKSTQDQLNPIERKLQQQDEIDWAAYKMDLNRMNSLTSSEKQGRTKRETRKEGNLIVKPLEYISEINTNETAINDALEIDLDSINYKKVESFASHYDIAYDLNDFISDVSIKFHSSTLDKVRCVLHHLAKIRIVEESSAILQTKPKLSEVQLKGEASIFQINYIFKKILDALRIPSEVVLGFWKKPNEFYHNEQYVINHSWLSVLVHDSFRLIDILNFVNPLVCNLQESTGQYNEFYFMAEPLSLVSTHIPSIIDLQHVTPPIDPSIAFYLPRTYSGFYKNRLQFANFNNALTRLNALEVFELELYVPKDVELFTLIKTSKVTTNDLTLCQVKWVNHKRMAKIKAILPHGESIGVLQIFAGPKGFQKHFDNIHELSIVIPLMHEGRSFDTKFVQRYPTVQSQNHDLYIIKPQTNKLVTKNSYTFEVEQYPSQGIDSRSAQIARDFKVVIESPLGKYFKLTRGDSGTAMAPFGVYSSTIKCQEAGLYRGLVIGDSGNSWYVFAQWESVNGHGSTH